VCIATLRPLMAYIRALASILLPQFFSPARVSIYQRLIMRLMMAVRLAPFFGAALLGRNAPTNFADGEVFSMPPGFNNFSSSFI